MQALQIRGSGHSFAILRGTQIIGRATSNGNAIAALPGIQRRLQTTSRPCLNCGSSFQSRGAGHRLCPSCGKDA